MVAMGNPTKNSFGDKVAWEDHLVPEGGPRLRGFDTCGLHNTNSSSFLSHNLYCKMSCAE
jgi:hypothetical protein